MLKRRCGTFWFRRRVPTPLVEVLGRTEYACSLRTGCRREAEARSRAVWLRVEEVFRQMAENTLARDQAFVLLRALAREAPWEQDMLKPLYERARKGERRDLSDILTHTKDDILALPRAEQVQVVLHLRELAGAIDAHQQRKLLKDDPARLHLSRIALAQFELDGALTVQAAETKADPEPTIAEYIEPFLKEKTRKAVGHKPYGIETVRQTRTTFRLWGELMGEIPVTRVTGKEAGRFRELLLQMPASHGKAVGKGPNRTAALHPLSAIKKADARDKAAAAVQEEADVAAALVPRLSLKTVKRHFSAMQQLWKYMRRRSVVDVNPFSGFEFPGTRSTRNQRDMWSEADLLTLLRSEHMRRVATARSRDWWMVIIAMYSGMRLEEICRLRPGTDVTLIDGTLTMLIQEQLEPPPPWSPKSEAGERAVPVHPMLLELGFAEWVASRGGQARVVPGTRPYGPAKTLGAEFSRQFSKVKRGLKVGQKTVFHSFRANVSTILRNEDTSIRDVWIDAVLGHDGAGHKSLGITVYLKNIGIANLKLTVERIHYSEAVEAELRELVALKRAGPEGPA